MTDLSACLSVPTLDEKAWRASEPHTPHPRARLEAVGELNAAGIPTGILIAPLMPGINDDPEQVERIIEMATENGAVSIGGNTLFLRGAVRGIFMDWLQGYRPDLVPRYEKLYSGGRAYVAEPERRRIERAAGLPGEAAHAVHGALPRGRAGMRRPEPSDRPCAEEVGRGRCSERSADPTHGCTVKPAETGMVFVSMSRACSEPVPRSSSPPRGLVR